MAHIDGYNIFVGEKKGDNKFLFILWTSNHACAEIQLQNKIYKGNKSGHIEI
jgi:hypothetical protein